MLAVLAVALGLYVYLVEIRGPVDPERAEEASKRVIDVEAEAVRELELPLTEGGRARLVRDGAWRLASPVEFPADERAVTRALEALEQLESDLVIDAPPGDLEAFGLSQETRRTVLARTDDATLRVFLGAAAPVGSARYFALGSDASRIYTAQRAALDPLSTSLFGLRDKRLVDLEVTDVTELQVRVQGSLIVTAVRGEDDWRLVAPEEEPGDAKKIERLLEDLVLARAAEFIDDPRDLAIYGLDDPELQLSLIRAGGETSSLELGRAEGTGYVRADGATVLYAVPERLLNGIPRAFFDYRHKRVFELEQADAKRIELRFPRSDAVQVFFREDSEWISEDESVELRPFVIEDLLFAIRAVDATGLEPAGALPVALGLDPPTLRVTAYGEADAELGWLELGDASEGDVSARSSMSERLWRVAGTLAEDVPLGLEAFQNRFVAGADD